MKLFLMVLAVAAIATVWFVLRPKAVRPARARNPTQSRAAPRAVMQAEKVAAKPKPKDEMLPAIAAILAEGSSALEAAAMPEMLRDFSLLGPGDLDPLQREELASRLAAIMLPPRSMQRLMSPEFMANMATREFTDLVTREPLLSAKVIGRVNSAFYGLASPIVSVAHAVTYLGMNAVRNMTLQFALEQAFASDDPQLQEFHARLFDTGTIAAELTAVLAPKLGVRDVGVASTQTVLTFLGDFAMPSLLPPRSAISHWPLGLLERTINEQFTLGTNAMIVGRLLMESWELPATVSDDVADIHRVLVTPPGEMVSAREGRIALCYVCARLAERIVAGRVQDPADLELAVEGAAEFHHMQSYLARPPLARLPDYLRAGDTKMAVARMIAAVGRGRETAHQRQRTAAL
jgi:HD-like signal output (HDOD) protein